MFRWVGARKVDRRNICIRLKADKKRSRVLQLSVGNGPNESLSPNEK